jgi:hypothetical protein
VVVASAGGGGNFTSDFVRIVMTMRRARVDTNQPEIVEALRAVGAHVLHTHQLKNAFDILVGFRGQLYIMEIKDGAKPPSRHKLTEGEQQCQADFAAVGVPYYVVLSVEDALCVIGAI